MQLDPEGWLEIDKLLQKASAYGTPISLETLHEIVATSDNRRFALSEDGLRIRAKQGHSVADVDLGLSAVEPPETLFHGTVQALLASIQEQGLNKKLTPARPSFSRRRKGYDSGSRSKSHARAPFDDRRSANQ